MPDPSQIRTKEGRGGLSRSAAKAVTRARRSHTDELLVSIFGSGSVAQHFKDHPLDGESTISAIEVPGPGPGRGPAVPTRSASDPVADTADWFKGGKGEGDKRSTPAAVKPKAPAAPDLSAAIAQAQMGLEAQRSLEIEVPVGITGGEYQIVLDEMSRPPNTDMF